MEVNHMGLVKTREEKDIQNKMAALLVKLDQIYSNKSSDEYKMMGDISKSKVYDGIENMMAHLTQLKGYPKHDASSLKQMFNALHRPIYKKLVAEYIHQPNDRNSLFTAMFTCGYRVLVAELSRIFACTNATEKGLVYKPNKIARSNNAAKFIKAFNNNLDQKLDEYIRKAHSKSKLQLQSESYVLLQEDVATAAAGAFTLSAIGTAVSDILHRLEPYQLTAWFSSLADVSDFIFGARSEINPVSYMHHVLTSHYDKNVAAFYAAEALYAETQKAYEEYMKIPDAERSKKVESKYMKLLKKYNMKMENLRAKIAHYDSRAMAEAKEKIRSIKESQPTPNTPSNSSGSGDTKGNDNENKTSKPTNIDTTPDKDVNTPTNDAPDLDW